jgi:RNA polymerase sigma-70 factor (ECF subfamily)
VERRVEEPDPVAIRAAMAGDLAAFESLVRFYQAPVWRFLRHELGDATLAEDATQETFLRVYRSLPTFGFRSKFSTWLFQIARHAGIDAQRATARRLRLVRAIPPPRPAGGPEIGAELAAALASLSPKFRDATVVVEIFGFSYDEAGAILGVPAGTVKSRVFEARRRLAAWLEAGESAGEM